MPAPSDTPQPTRWQTAGVNRFTRLVSVSGSRCSKRWTRNADGTATVTPYGNESHWFVESVGFTGFSDFAAALVESFSRRHSIIIRGALIDDNAELPQAGFPRRIHGFQAPFRSEARSWVALDFDGLPMPESLHRAPVDEQIMWLSQQLPGEWRNASFVWQLTSSHGMGVAGTLNCRMWFMTDAPVSDVGWRGYWRERAEPLHLDLALFRAVQPHYVAAPEFVGMTDPFPVRHGTMAGDFDAVPISAVMDEASRLREQVGGVVTEALPDGLANRQQIAATIERINRQETTGARHHHLVGAACELYALGCGLEVAESVLENLMRRQGREPALREVRDAWTYAQQRQANGTLRTDNPPVASHFAAPVVPPTPAQAAANRSAADDVVMETADWTSNDYLNARLYLRREYPDGTLLRTAEVDYEWRGAHWHPMADPEILTARIARASEMKASRVEATAKSVRSIVHEEGLTAPCWRSTRRDASRVVSFANGNLDVEKWAQGDPAAFTAPNPDLFVTTSAPYAYNPDATCPVFDAFIESLFPGDEQARRELLKVMGYLLTPDTSHQKMFIFGGVRGSGKSTLVNLIRQLVGEASCCAPSIASLSTNFGPTGLLGKSVAMVAEANNGGDLKTVPMAAVDLIKRITGRDEVQIDRKHKAVVTLALPLRFVFACNRLPHFIDPSGAMARRIQLFWFRHSHVGREDIGLPSRLELELSGIANRALEGLRYLLDDGRFKPLESAADVMRNYVRQMSPVGAFVEDCMQPDPSGVTARSDLVQVYRAWCVDSGRQPLGTEKLISELIDACPGVREVRANDAGRTRKVEGLSLTAHGRGLLAGGGVFA